MYSKQFKDPIYDYIEIERSIVAEIIDTPAFQRLKDIRQTSYAPLYPAAHHNRYVHSLGVYHLGKIAFRAIKSQLIEKSKGTSLEGRIESFVEPIFELACLLHDAGHAPFSHTGEDFFLDEAETLYNALKQCVDVKRFSEDFDRLGTKKPAPHECMSCVVGLRRFAKYFPDADSRELFARCITGISISAVEREKKGSSRQITSDVVKARAEQQKNARVVELLNCVIGLLNSSIIDVDRLDYIIRDSATMGFNNIEVDYERLLKGMRIVTHNGKLCVGYHKSALSIIESAVYAHDAEKKWVQSHPSILYEMEIIRNAMNQLTSMFRTETDSNPLFCYEALTEEGKELTIQQPLFSQEALGLYKEKDLFTEKALQLLQSGRLGSDVCKVDPTNLTMILKYPVSLLADEDFLYLMKRYCKNELGYEYFARNKRRIPVWKSEAEFKALFQGKIGETQMGKNNIKSAFDRMAQFCLEKTGAPIVNEQTVLLLEHEIEEINRLAEETGQSGKEFCDDMLDGIQEKQYWVTILQKAALQLNLEFDFLISFQRGFNSSFKDALGDIPILFPNIDDAHNVVPLSSVVDVLNVSSDRNATFFHLYYKPKEGTSKDKKEIVNTMARALINGANNWGREEAQGKA